MQGVKVVGSMIWSPITDGNGPAKLYQAFGDCLSKNYSTNDRPLYGQQLEAMAVSVIRDTVANMGIMEMLQSRNVIKKRIIDATQQAVKGWGINVETIEISEVKISSAKFFGYL
jgi:uncharacterized membrane protein YqiK